MGWEPVHELHMGPCGLGPRVGIYGLGRYVLKIYKLEKNGLGIYGLDAYGLGPHSLVSDELGLYKLGSHIMEATDPPMAVRAYVPKGPFGGLRVGSVRPVG